MIYKTFSPAPILSDIVEHYWYSKIDLTESAIQHYTTPLLQGLVFNFKNRAEEHIYNNRALKLGKSAYIFGQPVSPRIVTTHEKGVDILGVKFKPLGITRITGINMAYLADQIIAAEDIWGNELELLCDKMQSASSLEKAIDVLETFLITRYLNTALHFRVDSVQAALKVIANAQGNINVKMLQEQTNTTRKTLERAFINYLGIHPKLYIRITRFNTIKNLIATNWDNQEHLSTVALDFGFYDSSHFIAEFKHFSGYTPHNYLKKTTLNLVVKDI